jgi:hypothetical protein
MPKASAPSVVVYAHIPEVELGKKPLRILICWFGLLVFHDRHDNANTWHLPDF